MQSLQVPKNKELLLNNRGNCPLSWAISRVCVLRNMTAYSAHNVKPATTSSSSVTTSKLIKDRRDSVTVSISSIFLLTHSFTNKAGFVFQGSVQPPELRKKILLMKSIDKGPLYWTSQTKLNQNVSLFFSTASCTCTGSDLWNNNEIMKKNSMSWTQHTVTDTHADLLWEQDFFYWDQP